MTKPKIRPRGFFERFLRKQLDGLTGHIEQAGYPFDKKVWESGEDVSLGGKPSWWAYEQTAYWLDGYTRCGILLGDEEVIARAARIIYAVLDCPDSDGFLGPAFLKTADGGTRWPFVVFFRACMALYEYNGDEKILTALTNHYLGGSARHIVRRDVINVEIMAWLYEKTGNKALLDLAEAEYAAYNAACTDDCRDEVALSAKKPYAHGVSYNEYGKLGAILFTHTGKREYLNASIAAYKKIDRYFMLPSGCHCSDEFMGSNDCMHSHETCDVSDFSWSLGYLFDATKNAEYADKLEKCVLNAGIGSALENFRGLQYFSCANQIIADSRSNHNKFNHGSKWMSYRPNPGTECCPGNVNRFMPNYILNSMKRESDIIYVALFCSGDYDFGDVQISEHTDFPFKERVDFDIKTQARVTLKIRMPAWADGVRIAIDGKNSTANVFDDFITLELENDCAITAEFSSSVKIATASGGVYFQKGALVYSLGQFGRREIDSLEERASADFPAYEMYPTEKWNYGVCPDTAQAEFFDGDAQDFDLRQTLPHIEISAHEARDWELICQTKILAKQGVPPKSFIKRGDYRFTPSPRKAKLFSPEAQRIKLYPFGACKLRITVFPKIKNI